VDGGSILHDSEDVEVSATPTGRQHGHLTRHTSGTVYPYRQMLHYKWIYSIALYQGPFFLYIKLILLRGSKERQGTVWGVAIPARIKPTGTCKIGLHARAV
jgi:hypothetical protein